MVPLIDWLLELTMTISLGIRLGSSIWYRTYFPFKGAVLSALGSRLIDLDFVADKSWTWTALFQLTALTKLRINVVHCGATSPSLSRQQQQYSLPHLIDLEVLSRPGSGVQTLLANCALTALRKLSVDGLGHQDWSPSAPTAFLAIEELAYEFHRGHYWKKAVGSKQSTNMQCSVWQMPSVVCHQCMCLCVACVLNCNVEDSDGLLLRACAGLLMCRCAFACSLCQCRCFIAFVA